MIKIPVRVKKSDLDTIWALRGKANLDLFNIRGTDYGPDKLIFAEFEPLKVAPGIWAGDFCFKEINGAKTKHEHKCGFAGLMAMTISDKPKAATKGKG
ncbi:MAG: hypothetical protein IID41_14895 [Planctomycetes bacterium]|nr:hypothetical protein [Planctomycetota bacterium]